MLTGDSDGVSNTPVRYKTYFRQEYLTIIPWARVGYERVLANEAYSTESTKTREE